MTKNTKIEWATHTFNPWEGCQKIGPGCDHCYAEARNVRFGAGVAVNWGPSAPRRRTSVTNWNLPRAWNKQHQAFETWHGHRQRVFCASLADVFDNAVDPAWRVELLQLIADTPNLDWLLLTKRIGNAHQMLDDALDVLSHGLTRWGDAPWPNVWIGATVVDQEEADRDVPKLLDLPAAKRFLSLEPLLGAVDLAKIHHTIGYGASPCSGCGEAVFINALTGSSRCAGSCDGPSWPAVDWVITGGESGPGARAMDPDWVRSLRDQCFDADVPFLFKQWGEWAPNWLNDEDGKKIAGSEWIDRMGKKIAGRELDGITWHGIPE